MSDAARDTPSGSHAGDPSTSRDTFRTPSPGDDSSDTTSICSGPLDECLTELIKIADKLRKGPTIITQLEDAVAELKTLSVDEITFRALEYCLMKRQSRMSCKENAKEAERDHPEEMETTDDEEDQEEPSRRQNLALNCEASTPTTLTLTLENLFDDDTILIVPHDTDEAPAIFRSCRKEDGSLSAYQVKIPNKDLNSMSANLQVLVRILEYKNKHEN